jgi:2-amino-4-hydroxy-6-hydroxymethyldihydropteridine diphosphokinase
MPLAAIALGGNLPSPAGPSDVTLAAGVTRLASIGRVIACSSLYSTAPVGFTDQPRFLNAALTLETSLSPFELLGALLTFEQEFGRDRLNAVPDGPRTLDLDLILYGDLVLALAGLEIPHPRFAHRAFVLVPLNQIAPDFRDPRTGRTVSELLQALRGTPPGFPADEIIQIESDPWRATIAGASASDAPPASSRLDPDHD